MPSAAAPSLPVRLSTPIAELHGVGPRRAELFTRLGLHTVSDLLRHLPMRYEQHWAESLIRDLPMNAIGTARGTIVATRYVPAGRSGGKGRFEATLQDHQDRLYLVWFGAAYLRKKLHPSAVVRVQGKVKAFGGYAQMVNPTWEPLEAPQTEPARDERLRPVYPATEDLGSAVIESIIAATLPLVLDQLVDPLPEAFLRERAMPSLADAFRHAHQPEDEEQAAAARRRLAYNELLLLQLGIALKRYVNRHLLTAPPLRWSAAIDQHIRARFPFQLTDAQEQVVRELARDLRRREPMNRLVQGDVGSGKTVVALYALLMAVCDRKQGALMAPTELLAEQHYSSINDMLRGSRVNIALLTGAAGARSAERKKMLAAIEGGETDIVIGTQALLSEKVRFHELAVVVVDEQHRFGVLQRASFRGRAIGGEESDKPRSPHYLVMTATPIPRTLSLTVFGDLDISTIGKLPPGRTPIVTRVVGPEKTAAVYDYLVERVGKGDQAYVVVPAVEESDEAARVQLKNVRKLARELQKRMPDHRVAEVHGRLDRPKRETIMQSFRAGAVNVLVATTVIEVGVDVPNATLMVVEHAERFGLAQLHQLRGRIGRGAGGKRSVCVFIADPVTDDAKQRMEVIGATTDGFRIAEKDLEIRGMGDFFGTRQHGLPPLRVARIPGDIDLLRLAKRDAEQIVTADPHLHEPQHERLRKLLKREYGEALALIDVG